MKHADPRGFEHGADLVLAPGVVVVIAEHRVQGRDTARQASASTLACSDPVRGEVAREENDVGPALERREARTMRPRSGSAQWMSPAAASRSAAVMPAGYPRCAICPAATGTSERWPIQPERCSLG